MPRLPLLKTKGEMKRFTPQRRVDYEKKEGKSEERVKGKGEE